MLPNTRAVTGGSLVFDGDCSACTAVIDALRRWARPSADAVAFQQAPLDRWGLTEHECSEAVQWVGAEGERRSGAAALAMFLLTGAMGRWRVLGHILSTRPVQLVAAPTYRLVARHRHRVPGASPVCRMQPVPSDEVQPTGGRPALGQPGESWLAGVFVPWLASAGWRGIVLATVIALQFAVPFAALLQPPPTWFGFQMYSGMGGVLVQIEDNAGATRTVPLDEVAAEARPDLDWTRHLPEHLCATRADVAVVRVSQGEDFRQLRCLR